MDATAQTRTVAVLETSTPNKGVSFRIKGGRLFCMGQQFFIDREETDNEPWRLTCLVNALPKRSFRFCGRKALLLVCGEVTVVQGRTRVHFHCAASQELRAAIQAERSLILNPTHTRMGNSGTIKAWRRFLSKGDRVYLSASNWGVAGSRKQRPSPTLHSLWHGGRCKEPFYKLECVCFSYQEWVLPG